MEEIDVRPSESFVYAGDVCCVNEEAEVVTEEPATKWTYEIKDKDGWRFNPFDFYSITLKKNGYHYATELKLSKRACVRWAKKQKKRFENRDRTRTVGEL